jgi:hypothetical protein
MRSHAAARDARSMKPVPVSSVERVRCQYAGDGDRKARRVSRGAGAEIKKKRGRPKPKTAISPTGVDTDFPQLLRLKSEKSDREEDSFSPFLAIFPISSGAFPPRTRSLAFHETPESTWKRVQMSETAERLFSHRHSF